MGATWWPPPIRALQLGTEAATLIAGWNLDATYWLTDAMTSASEPMEWTTAEHDPDWRPVRRTNPATRAGCRYRTFVAPPERSSATRPQRGRCSLPSAGGYSADRHRALGDRASKFSAARSFLAEFLAVQICGPLRTSPQDRDTKYLLTVPIQSMCIPLIARAITSRWISDVPSKMV